MANIRNGYIANPPSEPPPSTGPYQPSTGPYRPSTGPYRPSTGYGPSTGFPSTFVPRPSTNTLGATSSPFNDSAMQDSVHSATADAIAKLQKIIAEDTSAMSLSSTDPAMNDPNFAGRVQSSMVEYVNQHPNLTTDEYNQALQNIIAAEKAKG